MVRRLECGYCVVMVSHCMPEALSLFYPSPPYTTDATAMATTAIDYTKEVVATTTNSAVQWMDGVCSSI
jgi:hypothetical protein